MKEIKDNIWDYQDSGFIVIPTNGFIRKDGACVMGRGLALQAKNKYPGLEYRIGRAIHQHGNVPIVFYGEPACLITFPVKHNWWEKADIELIEVSANILSNIQIIQHVYLPRVGCGNGGLDWSTIVKPVIEPILNHERFIVVDWNN